MYLTPTNQHWACDIEADGLLDAVTTIWCVVCYNCITKEKKVFTDGEAFKEWLEDNPAVILVGHNFLGYDVVVLNRLWGCRIPASKVVDTFVLSQLYNPSLSRPRGLAKSKGPHSLEAWGIRLNYRKSEHSDFTSYSPEMLRYCTRDTVLTAYLFRKLASRMSQFGFTERGAEIEHLAWNIIQNKQRKNGFPFDVKKAEELHGKLKDRCKELEDEIYRLWPPEFQEVRKFAKCRKGNGSYTKGYERHREQYPELRENPDGTYSAYDWVKFNLGSPDQRVKKLLELGWTPTQFTAKTDKGGGGNPKVDEDSLTAFAELSGRKEIVALSKWIVLNNRANTLFNINKKGEAKGWLSAVNPETGAIHGRLFIASTLRYRHTDPNSANIPAVRLKKDDDGNEKIQYGEDGFYTYECRDLWTCGDPAEWSLVGLDGTGIQNRCLVHHLILTVGEEAVKPFKDLSLSGDIHKRNIEVLGLANKAAAKKFYYTLMMGGAGARLAADQAQFGTKMTAAEGAAKKAKLIATIPGFKQLISNLEKELKSTGRIKLSDGTPILVSSPHMVIPYLLQGDESRLMKQAMIYVDQEVRRAGIGKHVLKVADIHDEWQYRVRNEAVERFIGLALPCFRRSGDSFGYRIDIDGDAKVGKTWAQTH